jgi:DNA-binding NarL/FixJ family response regulator
MLDEAVPAFTYLNTAMETSLLEQPTILLADDHSQVLAHVRSVLKNFRIVGTVSNGRDLVSEALRLNPKVIVTDITMPLVTGIEAIRTLREAGFTGKFIFLTIHEEPAFLHACFSEGALGYVSKSRLGMDLIPAINDALSGHRFIFPSVPR